MGLLDRMRAAGDAFLRPQASGNRITDPGDLEKVIRSLNEGGISAAGEAVTILRASGVAAVYACVRIITQSMAHLPLVLYEIDGTERRQLRDDPLFSLLHDQPNEWQTSFEWRELMIRDLELRGNAYALILRGFGGRVNELIRLHPDQVAPKQDERLAVSYEYRRAGGQRVVYAADEVLHIRGLGDDGLKGMNPIAVHRETIGDALAQQQHGSRFYSNGAKPLGALEFDLPPGVKAELSQTAREQLKADFESAYSGGANAHKTLMVPYPLKYKPLSISQKDAEYIASRKFTRGEVFAIFGIPPHKAGDLERATFSNIEHQSLEFVQDAIIPRAVRFEQAIKRDLLGGDPRRYVKFNIEGLLRGDFASRQKGLETQRRNGIINANEWRAKEDLNRRTDPGGDEYIIEANMRADDGAPAPPSGDPNDPAQTS